MNLAMRIKLFRVAASLPQKEVADSLGVSTNYVSMIERGKREPTLKYLKSFARLVKVPLAVLLWEPPDYEESDTGDRDLYARLSALMAQFANLNGIRKSRSV